MDEEMQLVLHPTDTSQWHALVYEAQSSLELALDVESESYLVFLLMRFMHNTQVVESIIAMDFLESMQACGRLRAQLLSDVGDKSLLFCGLFPGLAAKRCVGVDYFVDMGRAAYFTASELYSEQLSELYSQLGHEFKTLQRVLQQMRGDCLAVAGVDSAIISDFGQTMQ